MEKQWLSSLRGEAIDFEKNETVSISLERYTRMCTVIDSGDKYFHQYNELFAMVQNFCKENGFVVVYNAPSKITEMSIMTIAEAKEKGIEGV